MTTVFPKINRPEADLLERYYGAVINPGSIDAEARYNWVRNAIRSGDTVTEARMWDGQEVTSVWGVTPQPGDLVHVDLGDSIVTGGEINGRVVDGDGESILVSTDRRVRNADGTTSNERVRVYFDRAMHIEVVPVRLDPDY